MQIPARAGAVCLIGCRTPRLKPSAQLSLQKSARPSWRRRSSVTARTSRTHTGRSSRSPSNLRRRGGPITRPDDSNPVPFSHFGSAACRQHATKWARTSGALVTYAYTGSHPVGAAHCTGFPASTSTPQCRASPRSAPRPAAPAPRFPARSPCTTHTAASSTGASPASVPVSARTVVTEPRWKRRGPGRNPGRSGATAGGTDRCANRRPWRWGLAKLARKKRGRPICPEATISRACRCAAEKRSASAGINRTPCARATWINSRHSPRPRAMGSSHRICFPA